MILHVFLMTNYSGCDNGRYGLTCGLLCGHCKESETCFHTTGICPHGCLDGYTGVKCKTRKYETHYIVH